MLIFTQTAETLLLPGEREREMRALETCLVFSYVPDDSSSTSIRHGSLSVKALLVFTSKATRTVVVVVFFFKFDF